MFKSDVKEILNKIDTLKIIKDNLIRSLYFK